MRSLGMLYLIIATLSWSLVGVLIKTASFQFDPYTISFARFSIGVASLAAFLFLTRNSLRPALLNRWIWIGALGKSINYLLENLGVSIGYAYGNVIVYPIQTVTLIALGYVFFQEKLTGKGWISLVVVLLGVMLITWNGLPLSQLLGKQGWIFAIFVVSGIGAAIHLFSQKMLLESMNDLSMNYSIFLWCSILSAIPLPFAVEISPTFFPGAWLCAIALGLITGLSFLLSSRAMRTVTFSVAAVVANLPALFTVIWAALFYREPVTGYVIGGAALVLAGMTLLNWPARKARRAAAPSVAVEQ